MIPEVVSARIAGAAAPRDIVRQLSRTFPNVRLAWNTKKRRWVLIQRLIDGSWEPFRTLGTKQHFELPNYANTVGFVGKLEHAMRTKASRARLLAEMDATDPTIADRRRAMERVRAGNEDMANLVLKPSIRVPIHGLKNHRR